MISGIVGKMTVTLNQAIGNDLQEIDLEFILIVIRDYFRKPFLDISGWDDVFAPYRVFQSKTEVLMGSLLNSFLRHQANPFLVIGEQPARI